MYDTMEETTTMNKSLADLLAALQVVADAERSVGTAFETALKDNTAQEIANLLGVDRSTVYYRMAKYRGQPYRQGGSKDVSVGPAA